MVFCCNCGRLLIFVFEVVIVINLADTYLILAIGLLLSCNKLYHRLVILLLIAIVYLKSATVHKCYSKIWALSFSLSRNVSKI